MNRDVLDIIRNSSFDRNALNQQADQTGSGRAAVEKDFVISIILMLISELPDFTSYSEKMAFRGGTCIRKVFYPDETRFSEDLDFTNLTVKESTSFLEVVNSLTGKNLGVTTFERTEIEYQNERGLDFILYYTSVLQQRNHIAFNLSTASPLEEAARMNAKVAPYFRESPKVLTLSLNEIVVEKMRALLQRKKPRDAFDVWFLIHEKGIKLDKHLLRKKLQRSYDAAPFGKKKDAGTYVMRDAASRIRQSVTEKAWNNELGGLMMRLRPERSVVVDSVCEILSQMDDISLK
ncbi:MAG: nucleotidyl transferase AbiEii/AbiGii toxin family protein [Nitrososphaerales archaeon]